MAQDTFTFEIEKFDKDISRLYQFLLRVVLAIILWFLISLTTQNQYISDWFIIAPYLLPAILIVFPGILKILKFIPIIFLKLSSPKLGFLSRIPLVEFSGTWFIEKNSELIQFNSIRSIIGFFKAHWFSIFILPFSSFLFLLRIIGTYESDTDVSILDIDTFRENADNQVYYYTVFGTTILLLLYVSIVWVWHDAELKIIELKTSTKGAVKETDQIWYPSNVIKNIFVLFVGFDIMSKYLTGGAQIDSIESAIELVSDFIAGVLFDYFILEGGFIFIFMLILYYSSGTHEYLVNSVRKYISEQNSKENHIVSIGSSQILLNN